MRSTLEDFASTLATRWYRTLEDQLREMHELETRTREAMNELESEWQANGVRSSQTFHVRIRKGQSLPDSIHRVRICGSRRRPGDSVPRSAKPYRRWVKHLKGKPTRAEMYTDVRDVRLLDLFVRFYHRARSLNRARRTLVLGRLSIERRAGAHGEPGPGEGGEVSSPAPLLLPNDLPESSSRALGDAWRLFLRAAALQFELVLVAARYNATTSYKGLRLAFRTDSEHPYGRFVWTLHGKSLVGFSRYLKKRTLTPLKPPNDPPPRRMDPANLSERLMRKLRIPAAARCAIAPHELHRRRMTRAYHQYQDVLGPLFSTAPEGLARAQSLLRSAGFQEAP
ncbi:MAG TPA: hypothetical protein VEN81_03470 [Planctomycetota bacterium]|nr:hypothetical protein [Planctomycetota bacterium]